MLTLTQAAAPSPRTITLEAAVEDCMEAARGRLAKTSHKNYRAYLRRFAAWVGPDADHSRLTTERLLAYLDRMSRAKDAGGCGYRPRMTRTVWMALSFFCAWLTERGLVEANPFPRCKLPPLDKPLRPRTSQSDARRLLAACDRLEGPYRQALGRAVLYLLFTCLLRCSEMLHIEVSHLDLASTSEPSLLVFCGKGGKQRRVYLSDDCLEALRAFAALRNPDCRHNYFLAHSNRVWRLGADGLYRLLEEISVKAGFPAGEKSHKPHAFRRGGARQLVDAKVDIETVSKKLGHSNLAITQIYIEAGSEEQIAARNFAGLSLKPVEPAVVAVPPAAAALVPTTAPVPVQMTATTGWICPRCGDGLAPFVQRCGCQPRPVSP